MPADPNRWVPATLVASRRETAAARTLVLDAPQLAPALAGQHVTIRLTADDGYTAQREYSLSSPAGAALIEVTVERFDDGEVSPYLVDDLRVGDAIEVRGPIGGWLVWRPEQRDPVQLIGGGSGVAPLMAMVRTRAQAGGGAPMRLLYGTTDPDRVYYAAELAALAGSGIEVTLRYSRRAPAGSGLRAGRLTADDLAVLTIPAADRPIVYVCGPTGFVETIADALLALGHDATRVRTERFGPTT